jgi:hypothetical protein
MRFDSKVMAALAVVPLVLTQTPASAYDLPYDPYPWCAQYSGDGGGGTNCGFLTIEQCRADVSGIGGFCVRNQFYNPGYASAGRVQKTTILVRLRTSHPMPALQRALLDS